MNLSKQMHSRTHLSCSFVHFSLFSSTALYQSLTSLTSFRKYLKETIHYLLSHTNVSLSNSCNNVSKSKTLVLSCHLKNCYDVFYLPSINVFLLSTDIFEEWFLLAFKRGANWWTLRTCQDHQRRTIHPHLTCCCQQWRSSRSVRVSSKRSRQVLKIANLASRVLQDDLVQFMDSY